MENIFPEQVFVSWITRYGPVFLMEAVHGILFVQKGSLFLRHCVCVHEGASLTISMSLGGKS